MATTPVPAPSAAPQAQAPINHFGRIGGALFNPRRTFSDIASRPSWLLPIVLMTAISLVLSVVINQRVNWTLAVEHRLQQTSGAAAQLDRLKPEERQQAIERQAKVSKIFRYVRGVVGTLALAALLALVYWGLFNMLAGASLTYLVSLSVVVHALLPVAIRELIGIPVLYLKDPDTIDPENFVASNLGAVLSNETPLWQLALASSLDIFVIWSVVLVAIGFSAANPRKVSIGKGLAITFGVYAFFTLIGVGLAAVFS